MIDWLMTLSLLGADVSASTSPPNSETPAPKALASEDDAALLLAKGTRDRVLSLEAQLVQAIERLRSSTDQMIPGKVASEKATVAELREVIKLQLALAKSLDDNFEGYVRSARALAGELARGPERFKQAAAQFRKWADEESFKDLKSDYLQLASMWELAAASFAKRAQRMEPEIGEMREAVKYVQATAKFLKRLDDHLAVYDGIGGGVDRERYVEQLRLYIKAFEQLRQLLKAVLQKTAAEPTTAAIRPRIDAMLRDEELRAKRVAEASGEYGWTRTAVVGDAGRWRLGKGSADGLYEGAKVHFVAQQGAVGTARVGRVGAGDAELVHLDGAPSRDAWVQYRLSYAGRLVAYVAR